VKSRHRAREVALQILYQYDGRAADLLPKGHELANQLIHHFDHFSVPPELREFAAQLVAGTLGQVKSLDEMLEKHASNWKVARMGLVDRNLLRMSAYELLHMPESPSSVVIDEAIELGKQFGTAETPAFVNGILDAIKNARAENP
jgi:transcription antitermination protein NusB